MTEINPALMQSKLAALEHHSSRGLKQSPAELSTNPEDHHRHKRNQ
jgi:hypothetical protein